MTPPDPADYTWWLASRASGILAFVCIALSVGIGLAMAGRVAQHPRARVILMTLHQQTALVGLVAIAVHGITLLGDQYLNPGLTGIAVPFVIDHAPMWTAMGVIGGWLAAILGLSYWMRNRIGPARWRKLHRATLLVYVLAVGHTLGAGTDASEAWLQLLVVATSAPILFLFVMRILPASKPKAVADRFRRFRIAERVEEAAAVTSFALEPADGRPLGAYEPGQFVSVRVDVPGSGLLVRNYSLSTAPDAQRHRISVKREPQGAVSGHLHDSAPVGEVVDVAEPAGAFVLDQASTGPVALVSAGIGATPVLAMLAVLARARSPREIWWIHSARCGSEHAFAGEVRSLTEVLPRATAHVQYTRPAEDDVLGRDYDAAGRLTAEGILALGVPVDAEFYVCGPTAFLADLRAGLEERGVERLQSEAFTPTRHRPTPVVEGGVVDFARSGRNVEWDSRFANLLELAEASDIDAPSSCRAGACHMCAIPLLSGKVCYDAEPSAPPAEGKVLLCCARPEGEVVLDL